MRQYLTNSRGLFLLWVHWVVATGSLSLVVLLSLWLDADWMPIITFTLAIGVFTLMRVNRNAKKSVCSLILFLATRVLFWSGLVMLLVNIGFHYGIVHKLFHPDTLNEEIPFITILIVSPITFISSWWAKRSGLQLHFCQDCRMRNGSPAERGFLGEIFTQEGLFQVSFLLHISVVTMVASWIYYAVAYVNSDLNHPDKLVFFVTPVALLVIAALAMGIRLYGLWKYYEVNYQGGDNVGEGQHTRLRFMVIWDDYLALRVPSSAPDSGLDPIDIIYDTPTELVLPYVESMPLSQAEFYFNGLTDISDVNMRYMYTSISGNSSYNMFHFICFINDEQKEQFVKRRPDTQFFSLIQVRDLIDSHRIAPIMASEVHRLFTMTMAWKTYHRDGRRRYPVHGYVPPFRLRDAHKWTDLDYNDEHWLYVSVNNQDQKFYRLRDLWRRYINGLN